MKHSFECHEQTTVGFGLTKSLAKRRWLASHLCPGPRCICSESSELPVADGPKGIRGHDCLIDWQSGSLFRWRLDEPIRFVDDNLKLAFV